MSSPRGLTEAQKNAMRLDKLIEMGKLKLS